MEKVGWKRALKGNAGKYGSELVSAFMMFRISRLFGNRLLVFAQLGATSVRLFHEIRQDAEAFICSCKKIVPCNVLYCANCGEKVPDELKNK